jgi:parallel beta-helix repeat protein
MKYYLGIILTLCFLLTVPSFVYAATYYVSTTGNDSNPGTLSQPWKTVGKAIPVVSAGDTVYVRAGIYQENLAFTRSGTASSPIKISAYPGESPIIDGNNYTIAVNWGALLNLTGDYIQASGFEVRYSGGMGAIITGKNDLFDNINSHHNYQNGILITGDYGIVQNSQVWSNCMSNVNGTSTTGNASGLSAARHPNYAVIRHNIVYDNWGEGLSTYEANGTTIEDNIIYDNWGANSYISDAQNVLFQRNLIYATGATTTNGGGSQVGIMMGDENQRYGPSANNTVINNLVYGTDRNFYWWRNSIFAVDGMINDLVANNTFVNSTNFAGVEIADSPDHSNTRFVNNIIIQENSLYSGYIVNNITANHNLWSKNSPYITLDPTDINLNNNSSLISQVLVRAGTISPGILNGDWFKLTSNSPAIDKGASLTEVTNDYFKTSRPQGPAPDIGAHEYVANITPTPINSPTPTPTSAPKPGDANGDGKVDEADYAIWLSHFGQTVTGEASVGDFNGDGKVDGIDYTIWVNNYGK